MAAGFRGLLELVGVWLASPPFDAPTPTPTPGPRAAAHVRLYSAEGAPVGRWTGWGSIDVGFDMRGPVGTGISIPTRNGQASHRIVRPSGTSALIELDLRELGVPDVWLGQVDGFQDNPAGGSADFDLAAPDLWLSDMGVHDWPETRIGAGQVLELVIGGHTGNHRLDLGVIEAGPTIDAQISGLSLWDLLGKIEEQSGLEAYLTVQPGKARLYVNLRDPIGAPDARRPVTLVDGHNCADVEFGGKLATNTTDVVGVALAALHGTAHQSAGVTLPPGAIVGKAAALAASISPAAAAAVVGGPTILSPSTPTTAMMIQELAVAARQMVIPMVGGTCRITDSRMFPYMRPGTLVSMRIEGDALGYWSRASAQIRTVNWAVSEGGPGETAVVEACTVSFELWATEAS